MAECLKMCPDAEIKFRNENRLIHQLEATALTSTGPRSMYIGDRERMVKEYTRSAADTHKYNKPKLLRPFPVLQKTISYLLRIYEEHKDSAQFAMVFSFVSDRLRSVRQDMIMQRIDGENAIVLLEEMLPFYIEADAFCKQNKVSSYEPKLHDSQLEECFVRWFEQVEALKSPKISESITICFFLRQLTRKPGLLHNLYTFRSKISNSNSFTSKTFDLLHNIIMSYYSCNFVKFFRIFRKLDKLSQCSLIDAVFVMRLEAMKIISIGFKSPVSKISLDVLSDWLYILDDNLGFFNHFCSVITIADDKKVQISSISVPEIFSEELLYSGSKF